MIEYIESEKSLAKEGPLVLSVNCIFISPLDIIYMKFMTKDTALSVDFYPSD